MGTPDPSFSSNQTVDSGFNSKGTKVAPDAMSLMGRARRKGYKKTSAASSDAATGKKKKEV